MHSFPRQMHDLARTAGIRGEIQQEVHREGFEGMLTNVGGYTAQQFEQTRTTNQEALPVIIPAHNEGGPDSDLPATLLALARTGEAYPIVVNNRSEDDTVAIANRMGAIVIDAPQGRKMAATKEGIRFTRDELHTDAMGFTDADTLIPKRLPGLMRQRLLQTDHGQGALALGGSIKYHGPSKLADITLSTTGHLANYRSLRRGTMPTPHGHNFALQFDGEGKMQAGIEALPDDLFVEQNGPADDLLIARKMAEVGAAVSGTLNLDEYVLTRGDRVTSIGSVVKLLLHRTNYDELVWNSYQSEYNDLQ
ncbi:MAG TPA: glycosyltransferase [Candidatus Saccharimonadales bacterium]|nr:glycosyltransferase [Candidatus Saccharimonadales bacterium]